MNNPPLLISVSSVNHRGRDTYFRDHTLIIQPLNDCIGLVYRPWLPPIARFDPFASISQMCRFLDLVLNDVLNHAEKRPFPV